jgi:excisionase family DNA binding protein
MEAAKEDPMSDGNLDGIAVIRSATTLDKLFDRTEPAVKRHSRRRIRDTAPPERATAPVGDAGQLLTIKQAAEMLECSEAAVRKWLHQRRLPAVKVGRLTRLRQVDLEALVAKGIRPARRGAQEPL